MSWLAIRSFWSAIWARQFILWSTGPNNSIDNILLNFLYYWVNWHWEGAAEVFERSTRKDPTITTCLVSYQKLRPHGNKSTWFHTEGQPRSYSTLMTFAGHCNHRKHTMSQNQNPSLGSIQIPLNSICGKPLAYSTSHIFTNPLFFG